MSMPWPDHSFLIDERRPPPTVLARWEAMLSDGQYLAVIALVGSPAGRTYREAAGALGVSVNTLKTYLRRVRLSQPVVWAEVVTFRAAQRAERHAAAIRRAERRSTLWHRKQFFRRYGYWPRERR